MSRFSALRSGVSCGRSSRCSRASAFWSAISAFHVAASCSCWLARSSDCSISEARSSRLREALVQRLERDLLALRLGNATFEHAELHLCFRARSAPGPRPPALLSARRLQRFFSRPPDASHRPLRCRTTATRAGAGEHASTNAVAASTRSPARALGTATATRRRDRRRHVRGACGDVAGGMSVIPEGE